MLKLICCANELTNFDMIQVFTGRYFRTNYKLANIQFKERYLKEMKTKQVLLTTIIKCKSLRTSYLVASMLEGYIDLWKSSNIIYKGIFRILSNKIELFVKIVKGLKVLTIFAKSSILDV